MAASNDKIEVENINTPGRVTRVNAAKYTAIKTAMLKTLPDGSPGLSFHDAVDQVKAHLPQDLFPKGATSGWWLKTVQLDLEAKGVIVREDAKPLRWYRA